MLSLRRMTANRGWGKVMAMVPIVPVVSAPIPLVLDYGPALMWAIVGLLVVATCALAGAVLTAERYNARGARFEGGDGPMRSPRRRKMETPRLAA